MQAPSVFFPSTRRITSSQGCDSSITKSIKVLAPPTADFSIDKTCSDSAASLINLSTSSDGTINSSLWYFGDESPTTTDTNPMHTFTNAGTYNVELTVTSALGCFGSISKNIVISKAPEVDFDIREETGCYSSCFILNDITPNSNINSRLWKFGDGNSAYNNTSERHCYTTSGVYTITLTNTSGTNCNSSVSKMIGVEVGPELSFHVPNAFTPGKSIGINDQFSGVGVNICAFEMWIFDRWGNLIFNSNDYNKKWDGTANEGRKIAQRDVYVYIIKIVDYKGEEHTFKGDVTLIR